MTKVDRSDEIVKPKIVTREIANHIAAARNSKIPTMSQDDLAKKSLLTPAIIKEHESAKAPYNQAHIDKISKALGVFITGSDTSANALFGKLQGATATSIGIDPVITVGANVSGGVVGKMISPQSIAVGAAAGNLVGKESELFRFTVKHSFIMLVCICFIVLAQAYLFEWLIPVYEMQVDAVATHIPDMAAGYSYLGALVGLIALISAFILIGNKNKKSLN